MTARAPVTRAGLVVRYLRVGQAERSAARWLLRHTAAAYAAVPVDSVGLGRTPAGAPTLGGRATGLYASVSHTTGLVAVAISRLGPVGLDVEPLRDLPALGLGDRWFSPEEGAWLRAQPDDRRGHGFLLLWTGKEAVGKLYGTGLRGSGLRHRLAPPALDRWQSTVDDPAVLVTHRARPGFLLAVASRRRSPARPGPAEV